MKVLNLGGKNYTLLNSVEIHDELPLGVYNLVQTDNGPVLIGQEDIVLPEKIYSNDKDFIEHVLLTWENSDENLGVNLTGQKGLGKSFTANILAKRANVPIIKLTSNQGSPAILDYLNMLEQDFVLFIDEFDKLFKDSEEIKNNDRGVTDEQLKFKQDSFLSFLDKGVNSNNKKCLFIITGNKVEVNEYLKDRPSRIRYTRTYSGVSEELAKEIVEDLLDNQDYLEDIFENITLSNINIDTLIQVINEVNLHNKPYSQFKNFFNYTTTNTGVKVTYKIGKQINSEEFEVLISDKIEVDPTKANQNYNQRILQLGVEPGNSIYNGSFIDYKDFAKNRSLIRLIKEHVKNSTMSESKKENFLNNIRRGLIWLRLTIDNSTDRFLKVVNETRGNKELHLENAVKIYVLDEDDTEIIIRDRDFGLSTLITSEGLPTYKFVSEAIKKAGMEDQLAV